LDIFTCGDSCCPETAAERLIEGLECKSPSILELKRGTAPL